MLETVNSKSDIPIRLTDERWAHIIEEHNELAGMRRDILATIGEPAKIVEGKDGERLAMHEIETGKYLVVVYREYENDGFIITAFLTRRTKSLMKRKQIWPA